MDANTDGFNNRRHQVVTQTASRFPICEHVSLEPSNWKYFQTSQKDDDQQWWIPQLKSSFTVAVYFLMETCKTFQDTDLTQIFLKNVA